MSAGHAVLRGVARLLAAAVLGWAWNLGWPGIAASPAIIGLWRTAGSRWQSAGVVLLYHLGGAAPSLWAVAGGGYGDLSGAELVLIALLSASIVAGCWCALWSPDCAQRSVAASLRVLGVLALAVVPGIAAFTVASPLTAAGLWLPGLGWVGLALHAVMLSVLPARGLCLLVVAAVVGAQLESDERELGEIHAVRSLLAVPDRLDDFVGQRHVALAAQKLVFDRVRTTVLPEGIGGLWTDRARSLWAPLHERLAAEQRSVVLGATVPVYDAVHGVSYDAAAIVLEANGKERVVPQRSPLPFILWRPWQRHGYRAHWFERGIVERDGKRAGVLVCYDQMLVLPVLASVGSGASVLFGLSNLHRVPVTWVGRWQTAAGSAWGRLFDIEWYAAVNG